MTVVSIRCHECGEVKDKSEVEINADKNICRGCQSDIEIPEEKTDSANSDVGGDSKQTRKENEVSSGGDSDTPTDGGTNDENAEGDKESVKETFSEQDPLEW